MQAQAPKSQVGAGDQRPTLQIRTRPEEEASSASIAVDEESVRGLESAGRTHHHISEENAVGPNPAVGGGLSSRVEPEAIALRLEATGEEPKAEYRDESSPQASAHDFRPPSFRCRR